MHRLAQSVLAYIRKQNLLAAGDRVGIAVSGGADSVALLRLMLELRDEIGLVLSVVHLNHQLRGAESDADEAFVSQIAEAHSVQFLCDCRDVKAHAGNQKLSLEAAARELRYQFFREMLETATCDKVATAHTLDDQAETVLLKLARGAGTRGMAGIWPQVVIGPQPSAISESQPTTNDRRPTTGSIVRPLLSTRSSQLREYLAELGQTWREDSSNRDLRHTRNRIRHGVLPRLERHLNPNMREVLAQTAEIARIEEDYWAQEIVRLLPQVWKPGAPGGSVDQKLLAGFPPAVRRRLLRAAAESLGIDLSFEHVEQVLELKGSGSSLTLPHDWTVQLQADEIRFQKQAVADVNYRYELRIPGRIAVIEAGLEIEAVSTPESEAAPDSKSVLDSALVGKKLTIRNWHAGERFWPSHTKEPRKIKELLQDRHITGDKKQRWPVIAAGNEVVWLSGFGVRRDFQAKNGKGIWLRERPLTSGNG